MGDQAGEHEQPPAPGGPLRQDQPSGPLAPGLTPEGAKPADDDRQDGQDEQAGSVPPPTGTRPEQDDQERDLQAENAETSLDQPSS